MKRVLKRWVTGGPLRDPGLQRFPPAESLGSLRAIDVSYYRRSNPDLAHLSDVDLTAHFDELGWKQGRDPAAWFDTQSYLHRNPDVADAGINPLNHWYAFGAAEGRSPKMGAAELAPSPHVEIDYPAQGSVVQLDGFTCNGWIAWDGEQAPIVIAQLDDGPVVEMQVVLPRQDLVDKGLSDNLICGFQGRLPVGRVRPGQASITVRAMSNGVLGASTRSIQVAAVAGTGDRGDRRSQVAVLVDEHFYLSRNPDVRNAIADGKLQSAGEHYIRFGWRELRDPHPHFVSTYYAEKVPELVAEVDLFEHYLYEGYKKGLRPSSHFDGLVNESICREPMSPLERFIRYPSEVAVSKAGPFFDAQFRPTHENYLDALAEHPHLNRSGRVVTELPPQLRPEVLPRPEVPTVLWATSESAVSAVAHALECETGRVSLVLCAPGSVLSLVDVPRDVAVIESEVGLDLAGVARRFAEEAAVIVQHVSVSPLGEAAELALRTLRVSGAAIVGTTVVNQAHTVLSAGWECRNQGLEPLFSGYSPLHHGCFRRRSVDVVDPLFFAFAPEKLVKLDSSAGDSPLNQLATSSNELRNAGEAVVCQGVAIVSVPSERAIKSDTVCQEPSGFDEQKPVALLLDGGWPRPDRDAGSAYTNSIIDLLLAEGYDVVFGSPSRLSFDAVYTAPLAARGVHCLYDSYGSAIHGFEFRDPCVLMPFRFPIAAHAYDQVWPEMPSASFVFNTLDLHGLRELREAELAGNDRLLNLAGRTQDLELALIARADAATVVSDTEAQRLGEMLPLASIHSLTIPVEGDLSDRGFGEREGLCFVGSFFHAPNIDAVEFFVSEIWPLVFPNLPEAKFHIAGEGLPDQMFSDVEGVEYHGFVDDIGKFLQERRLNIVPLRFGAGIKGKILTSLRSGLPTVASQIGVEGMNLVPGKEIVVADESEEFAAKVVNLYRDETRWVDLSNAGRVAVERGYSLDVVKRQLSDVLESLGLPTDKAL